jgi:ParB family chromosome partitioning protein
MGNSYETIDIERCLEVDGFNARTKGLGDISDLVESIKAQGILQPLLGKDRQNAENQVEIYAGFRRLAAAKKLGLKVVPVILKPRRDITRVQMLLANVAENVPRANLNPVDEALRFEYLQKEHKMGTDNICASLGVKKSYVEKRMRLLKLNLVVREAVHLDKISISAAFDIDRLPKNLQERYVEIALGLKGQKLTDKIDKELEKIQAKLAKTEPTKKVDPAAAKENVRRIRKANAILCAGLGYTETETQQVKEVNYTPLDDDDLRVVAKLQDDCADQVAEDVGMNEKAQEEIVRWVESGKDGMVLDESRPVVQQALIRAIAGTASEIAMGKAQETNKRAKVTYDMALEALNEYFGEEETE